MAISSPGSQGRVRCSSTAIIRADAEGRYDGAEPGWRAGVEWTLLWIESTAAQLTEGSSADGRQGVSPE
ncbi:hypothetical protein [Streptomyces sp. NPDC017964]|uniref:hypothetical protein n=1 Tax=Streptomyces sp. NPDC017964 TaxID=3365022 RepID=UPI0037A8F208